MKIVLGFILKKKINKTAEIVSMSQFELSKKFVKIVFGLILKYQINFVKIVSILIYQEKNRENRLRSSLKKEKYRANRLILEY